MSNWYRRAQETGSPGAGGAGVNTGADPAVGPDPRVGMEEGAKDDAATTGDVDYVALDRQIKNRILKPLYEFYNTFVNKSYPDYEGDKNPFMVAMIQMYEGGTVIGFKRHLDAYVNVSRLVVSGSPDPALSSWVSQLLYLFPEGDAKIQLRQQFGELNTQAVMQEQTV